MRLSPRRRSLRRSRRRVPDRRQQPGSATGELDKSGTTRAAGRPHLDVERGETHVLRWKLDAGVAGRCVLGQRIERTFCVTRDAPHHRGGGEASGDHEAGDALLHGAGKASRHRPELSDQRLDPHTLEIAFAEREHSRRIADGADPRDARKRIARRSRSSAARNGITGGSRCCVAARTYDQPSWARRSCAVGSPASAAAVLASETKLSPHTPAARTSELECALRPYGQPNNWSSAQAPRAVVAGYSLPRGSARWLFLLPIPSPTMPALVRPGPRCSALPSPQAASAGPSRATALVDCPD